MKNLLYILFSVISISAFGQAQSDADLSTQSTDEIKNKTLNQTRIDNFNQDVILSKSSNVPTANTQTGNYTLTLTDIGKSVIMNVGSANDLTVPPNSSVAFPVGTMIVCFQNGAGLTTVQAGVGVTINNSAGNDNAPARYAPFVLHKTATDTWTLSNGLAGSGGGSQDLQSVLDEGGTANTSNDITIVKNTAGNEVIFGMEVSGNAAQLNANAASDQGSANITASTTTTGSANVGVSVVDGSSNYAQMIALNNSANGARVTVNQTDIILNTNNTNRLKIDTDGSWDMAGTTPGTSGQFLKTNGSGSSPTWSDASVAVGNITGLGSGVGTWLASATSTNLAAAITDETGSGPLAFSTSPALTGTPTAPTASPLTSTTQIATTKYVDDAVAAGGGGGGSGTVTNIATSNGITGGPITTTGTISGVNAAADGSTKGVAAFVANDFDATTGVVGIDYTNGTAASGSVKGFLTSADWTTFNGKQSGDADLTSWAAITRASGFDTFTATPSSANLASLVTDEVGSGALTFNGWVQGGNTLTGNQIFGDISATGFNIDFYRQNTLAMRQHGTGTTVLSVFTGSGTNAHRFIQTGEHVLGTGSATVGSAGSTGSFGVTGTYARISGTGVWAVGTGANTSTPRTSANSVLIASGAITAAGSNEFGVGIGNRASFVNAAQTGINFYAYQGLYTVNATGGSSNVYAFIDIPTITNSTGVTFYGNVVPLTKRNGFGAGETPSAQLHIGASTTAASTASIKIDEGSRQTTPEDGTINYVSNNLEFTETSTVYIIPKQLTGSGTIDFGSVSANGELTSNITVTGAADGDKVILGWTNAAESAGIIYTARVSATNTVTVKASNNSLAPIDPGSGTFKVSVIKD